MQYIDRTPYILRMTVLFAVAYFVFLVLIIARAIVGGVEGLFSFLFYLLGTLTVITTFGIATFYCLRLFHTAWSFIQWDYSRATPNQAVGLLFVPLFNLIWVFNAFWGFAVDYNAYVKENFPNAPRMNTTLFLIISILVALGFTGYLTAIVYIPLVVLLVIASRRINEAIQQLPHPSLHDRYSTQRNASA